MLDGKVLSDITGTGYATCSTCQCPPSYMNRYEEFKLHKNYKFNAATLFHGLPPVHTRMRMFIHLFNVSTKLCLDSSKSQVRGDENKAKVKARKILLQQRFRDRLNIRIEEPSVNGGTTTRGREARIALESPLLPEILELDPKMVDGFSALSLALCSPFMINVQEYDKLATETSRLYEKNHPNLPKNATSHKVLDHGKDFVKLFRLPPIFYSEEGSEGKNKFYRSDKNFHARLDSREHIMQDVFERNLLWSDPLIFAASLTRRIHEKQRRSAKRPPMSPTLNKILIIPEPQSEQQEINEHEEEEEEQAIDGDDVVYRFVESEEELQPEEF